MDLNVASEIDFGTDISELEVPAALKSRIATSVEYIDVALGGLGMTPSVVTLFTGTPGAGKSTMMLTLAANLEASGCAVIYNGVEESAYQTKMTVERLKLDAKFGMGQEKDVRTLIAKFDRYRKCSANKYRHPVIIIDSLQGLQDSRWNSGRITSKTSEHALKALTEYAKETYANVFVIGQVNKDGKMNGSNKLRHMCDAHVELSVIDNQKSEYHGCRRLFTSKNRFGGAGFDQHLELQADGFNIVP